MISNATGSSNFFYTGGILPPDSPCYVERTADDELFRLVSTGQFCHVIAPPQTGKSSLMVNTARRLRAEGIQTVLLYLSGLRRYVDSEKWFLGLTSRLKLQLKLSLDLDEWWSEQSSTNPAKRFTNFLKDVVLVETEGPIAIFIDEIESVQTLDFADQFFATIRSLYEARATDPAEPRLTFIILGAAIPSDLIEDDSQSPFPISHPIDLNGFTQKEAELLKKGLQAACPEQVDPIFGRILYWTDGHPYLTQELCLTVTKTGNHERWADDQAIEQVDWLVKKRFLSGSGNGVPPIEMAREQIENGPNRRRLLALYQQVYVGNKILTDEASIEQSRLKLTGLVQTREGHLKVYNPIYRQLFNLNWIRSNRALNLKPAFYLGAIVLVVAILLVMGRFSFLVYQQRQEMVANRGENFIDTFRTTTNPDARLVSLAGLSNLPGYEAEAQALFYKELEPEEQLALFESVDSSKRGAELIAAARGIYTSRALGNSAHDRTLLEVLAQSLQQLDYSTYQDSIDLELEITNWLKGKEYYDQEHYWQATQAYGLAIELNDRNPGIYFDRGLAYAAMGELDQALADFSTALNLSRNWQDRIEQALINNPEIYAALWSEGSGHRSLVALVPSPTPTPTPTVTPSPSPTPAPTDTPAPLPPTVTPLPTATATPTARISVTAAPSPTPTSGLPSGEFNLLHPLSVDDPTFGPTTFEWQWTGPLPPEYGFEVRVWREGNTRTGVHNAVLDNQNGNIQQIGENSYRLNTNITNTAGVRGQRGEYWWTVALVQITPSYADLGQEAAPARLRFETPGQDGGNDTGSDDGGGGGGGGVGVD